MTEDLVPVLIAGGGTVGLAAAVFLSGHHVPTLVVEAQPGPSPHPRATGLSRRTMEMLRAEGLEDAVDAVSIDMRAGLGKIYARTLAEAEFTATDPAGAAVATSRTDDSSPALVRGLCPQHRLDSVLLPAARERSAVVRYSTRLESFTQDDDGVRAVLSDGSVVRADYLIGADGARSDVRGLLDIAVEGPGPLGTPMISMLFRADLTPYVGGRSFATCTIENPDVSGLLVTVDGTGEWILHVPADDSDGGFPDARCVGLIRAAIGDPALDVEVISVLPWRPRGQLAERFRSGRVFLVGDAAHTVPPLGAFGLNTGVADAHNLAWKIAAVHHGWADPGLLDSYEAERRPVAATTLEQAVLRLPDPRLHWENTPEIITARRRAGVLNAPVVHVGYRYESTAVIGSNPTLPSTEDISLVLDGTPGSRLPHRWVPHDGGRASTLDLVGRDLTVLTADEDWADAAHAAADALSIPLAVHRIPVTDGDWTDGIGSRPDGVVLVRPDHVIAWRMIERPLDPRTALIDALSEILSLDGRAMQPVTGAG
ncbi:FAD-dependent monooxygenase [Nocardia sp. NPDC005746]|uniref:FAD-dependent monooxygenase n=1 Tax=Nocardia sp. NPDC005746 TaxID=3157062 RepID=UPI0034051F6E